MKAKLKQLVLNWANSSSLALCAIALASLMSGPLLRGGEQVLTVEEFNQLPREFRMGYLTTGPSKRVLGPKANVGDLVDELLQKAERAQDAKEKRGVAFALLAVNDTSHGNDQVIASCKDLAEDLLDSPFSRASVDVYFELFGDDSLPFLVEAVGHSDTATQIQAAKRLGHNVGTAESIPELQSAVRREETSGSETVAKYLREAIKQIERREALKGSVEEQANGVTQPGIPKNGAHRNGKARTETPNNGAETNDAAELNLPLMGVLGILVVASIAIAAKTRKPNT